jgi:hypothetical protein
MKLIYIVELRKGWLSHRILSTFDTMDAADAYEKQWLKENWQYLKSNSDISLEINFAKR